MRFAFLITLFGIYYNSTAQNNVFVSITGSDVTGTGSISNPYKTATKAVQSGLLTPGSNLYFRAGTYTNTNYQNGDIWKEEETVYINNLNGTSSQYINVKPYNNEVVTLRGDGDFIFQIRTSSYVKISGFNIVGETENLTLSDALYHQFEFKRNSLSNPVELRCPRYTNTDQSGLEDLSAYTIYRPTLYNGHGLVVQNSHHIEVFNNLVRHVPGEGMRFSGSDYLKFYNNEIHNCSRRSSGGVHGISGYNQRSIDNVDAVKTFISKNLVHDNYQELFSWSENKTIITATIDEGKGITLQRINGSNEWLHGRIQIDNNITYSNGFSGVHINDGLRVDIINNTCYMNCRSNRGNQIGISVQTGDDVKIYNNMVFTDLSFGGYSIGGSNLSNIVMSNNLINGNLDPDYNSIAVNTFTNSNFKWVDTLNRDFHLQVTSPAINNALATVTPATDYYGKNRDAQPDLGAVEYVAPLSASLLYFTGKFENDLAKLEWQTLNEVNVLNYELQYSSDGFTWKKVALISSKSNSSNTNQYNYQHKTGNSFTNYYRIIIIDKDGSRLFSNTLHLVNTTINNITVFPNPFINTIVVNGVLQNDKKIRITTIAGVDVTNIVNISVDYQNIKINTTKLGMGLYVLTINNQSFLMTK